MTDLEARPTCFDMEHPIEEETTQGDSASSKKLTAFGIQIDEETTDTPLSESETSSCYFLAQEATICSLI